MDLNFVVGNDQKQLRRIEELGCELESLFFISKDLFSIFDDLGLSSKESAEFFMRLKNVHDACQGKSLEPNIVVYENNRILPTRLSIENKDSGKTIFFRVVPGQGKGEKGNVLYRCEGCRDDQPIRRVDCRHHIQLRHNNLL